MSDDKKVIFSMVGVSKLTPAGKPIIKNIYLSFYYGAKIGIIGLNGSGKSTVMKIIAGLDQAYQGDVVFSQGYSVGYLAQEPELDENKTVKEIVMEGAQETVDVLKEFEDINNAFMDEEVLNDPDKMDKLIARQGEVQDKIDALDAWELDAKLERAMDALRCPPDDQKIATLSGGERRRVALCRLLLQTPDVLLLDEPTNHLDAESIEWLEQHLQQYKGTVIAVTHDRYFLDNVAGWILELDRGEGIPWKGNYSSWLEQKGNRLKQEEKTASKRQKMLERELEWVRMNPKARQAKSKARLTNYDKMLSEELKDKEEVLEIPIPNGPRLGNNVIDAVNVSKAFGDKLLYDDLNFKLPPAGIVGIVGPNGAGKTTIFKMIMDELQPDGGEFVVGETAVVGYVDQAHKDISPEKTIFEVVSNGLELIEIGNQKINARAYISKFNFSGSDQNKKVGVLSGGERNRLHLAMTLKTEANVLLLDEPTNDIDVNTLRALEEGILNFAGCAVIISHDRWFLDRICTHILAFEGDSHVHWFEGSYSEYEENKKKRLGDAAPKRIKYRKLVK
jgi:energy-dependent translational throttle protein EttA